MKKRKCSWRKARERTTMDETCGTPDDNTCFGTQRCLQITLGLEPSALCVRSALCEGGGHVVGVVTPLVGGVAQAFHDDQVVELRVQLGVQEVEGKEEDREEQVEVERERRLKEVRTWVTMEMFMTRLRS